MQINQRFLLLALVLASVIAACVWVTGSVFRPGPLAKATVLDWNIPLHSVFLGYDWLTTDSLVYAYFHNDRFVVGTYNCTDNKATVLAAATEQLNASMIELHQTREWLTSPEKRWLLCKGFLNSQERLFAVGLYNRALVSSPLTGNSSSVQWLPADAGWMELRYNPKTHGCTAMIFTLNGSNGVRSVALPVPLGYPMAFRRSDGSFMSLVANNAGLQIFRTKVLPEVVPLSTTFLKVKNPGNQDNPAFSPDGDLLAWFEDSRKLHFVASSDQFRSRLRVIDITSQKVRTICEVEEPSPPSNLKWTPDGKMVSFVSRGLLHCVSVR